jgi:hypothetical protein
MADAEETAARDAAQTILEELQKFSGGGEGLYALASTAADTILKYRDAITGDGSAEEGEFGDVQGWSSNVYTMYGGQAFETDEERAQVESFMNQHGGDILHSLGLLQLEGEGEGEDAPVQLGGGPKEDAAKAQKLIETMSQYIDPRNISLDAAVSVVLEFMTMMNSKMEDLSRQVGIIKLENTIHEIPLEAFGLPPIPTRALVVILTGVFEVIRLLSLFGFPGASLFRIFGSFSGGLLEAAKGDWKSAIFTFMGLMGNGGLVIGAFAKIIVKVMSFLSETKRDKLIVSAYEGAKSFVVGFSLFLFTTLSPLSVKEMVEQNLLQFQEFIDGLNEQIQGLKATLQADPAIAGKYELQFMDLEMKSPDFDSLQRLEDLFSLPAFACSKPVQNFVEQMKFVPPALLLLELMGINTTTTLYKKGCAEIPESSRGTIDAALIEALKPRLRPLPGAPQDALALDAARKAVDKIFGIASKGTPEQIAERQAGTKAAMGSPGPLSGKFGLTGLSAERKEMFRKQQEKRDEKAAQVREQMAVAGKGFLSAGQTLAEKAQAQAQKLQMPQAQTQQPQPQTQAEENDPKSPS